MSFFKDFKEDLSQAVNELIPDEDMDQGFVNDDMVDNVNDETVNLSQELKQLNELLDAGEAKFEEINFEDEGFEEQDVVFEPIQQNTKAEPAPAYEKPAPAYEKPAPVYEEISPVKEEIKMDNNIREELGEPTDTVTVITAGTRIVGSIESEGSVVIDGIVEGNVTCNGKITVTGAIKGDTTSSEFFADAARLEGQVASTGTVKVGLGSVIIGNISSTSAVVAGAIKGDIDVQGPVVVDTTAVVVGNVKSRSVQINNGAVIEGFCSQCYSDVDVNGIFGE